MAHFPLRTTDDGKSELPRDHLHKYRRYEHTDLNCDLEEVRIILLKELEENHNPEAISPKTLALLKRIVLYTKDLNFVSSNEKQRSLFQRFLDRALYTLFAREVLTPEEMFFLNFIIGGSKYLRGQYANFQFCEFLELRLKEVVKNENSSEEKLIQFKEILTVYQKYLSLYQSNFRSTNYDKIFDLEKLKMTLFRKVLKDLSILVRKQEMKVILKELFVFTNIINDTDSILNRVISNAHFEDERTLRHLDETQLVPEATQLEMSKFHEAGLLVSEEGGTLRLSDEWEELMILLECDIFEKLVFLFLHYERLSIEDPRHRSYVSFLKGSSMLKCPEYFVRQALTCKPESFLITRMANLNPTELRKLIPIILNHENLTLQNVALLLAESHRTENQILIDCCQRYLAKKMPDRFIHGPAENEIVELSESDFIKIVQLMNVSEIVTEIQSEDNPNVTIRLNLKLHVKMFPQLTVNGVNALIEKLPNIEFEGFYTENDSNLCDIVLSDGNNKLLYMNKAILSRSSEYLKALFSGNYKNDEELELDFGAIEVLIKWMPVILKPFGHQLKKETFSPANLNQCIEELSMARYLHLDFVFKIMDQFYADYVRTNNISLALQKNSPFHSKILLLKDTETGKALTLLSHKNP